MYFESQESLFFVFVDFGSAYKLDSKKYKVPIISPGYSNFNYK